MDIPLGERVMNLRDNGPIPFGLKGTVTGIVNNLLEVVFDEEFLGGTNLGNRCSDLRGQQHIPATTVLNLGRGHGAKRGGRNSGPQQNAWAAKADREQQGPRGQSQGQGQQAPHQHHQQQPRPNRGGQGADKPVTILSSRGGGGTEKRDVRKSGDKVAYRPKPQPQGWSPLLFCSLRRPPLVLTAHLCAPALLLSRGGWCRGRGGYPAGTRQEGAIQEERLQAVVSLVVDRQQRLQQWPKHRGGGCRVLEQAPVAAFRARGRVRALRARVCLNHQLRRDALLVWAYYSARTQGGCGHQAKEGKEARWRQEECSPPCCRGTARIPSGTPPSFAKLQSARN